MIVGTVLEEEKNLKNNIRKVFLGLIILKD